MTTSHSIPVEVKLWPRTMLIYSFLLLVALASTSSPRAQDFVDVAVDKPPISPVETTSTTSDPKAEALKQAERVTILAPKFLRPQSDYHVLINLANSKVPASMDLQLTGARDSNREQTEAKNVLASSGETQTVKFSIGDWPPAEYILSVTAQAVDRSWNFSQEASLTYQAKSYSAFIQTDKAIYKPGHLVQFRAIFVQPDGLKPLVLKEEIDVSVFDAKRNLIKQWKGLSNYRGLLSLNLQLSEEPVLGDWSIKVESRKQEISKQFRVAEYILPTYEVKIDLPSYATYNQSDIVATVRASYTYGKPVQGYVALTVQPLVRFSQIDTRPLEQAQYRTRLVNGSADINVDLVKDLHQQRDLFEREIEFFALVEEDLTGRKYNKTSVIKVHDNPIKVELVNSEDSFKPGLSHLLLLKVAYQDDTPVEDNGPELELRCLFGGSELISLARLRPVNGLIEHRLDVPKKLPAPTQLERLVTPQSIDLQASYRGHRHYLDSIKAFNSESEQYMQVSLPANLQSQRGQRKRVNSLLSGKHSPLRTVSVDEQLKVKVVATEAMQQVTCQGLARGDIIWALSKDAKNASQFEFEVRVDQKMAPEARILCFYIRPENKELIADSTRVSVLGLAKNFASIRTSVAEAKPGQKVQVNVLTSPNSLVGLLGIDQSVLLLKTGHDISQEDLAADVGSYGSSQSTRMSPLSPRNTENLLDQSDVIILTNNLVHDGYGYFEGVLYSQSAVARMNKVAELNFANGKIQLAPLLLDQEIQPPVFHINKAKSETQVIRSFFPETWIWANASAGSNGQAEFETKIPDTISSWVLSAFSLSESTGLGLAQKRPSIRVFRPFFIKLNLPYSIIRGETVSIQAIVFNYSKRPTQAKVILENRDGDFEFVEAANSVEEEKRSREGAESRLIRVPAEDGASVSYLIKPQKLGHIDIRVSAQGELAADAIIKKLLVKPEGQTQYLNKAMLVSLRPNASRFTRNVSVDIPVNAVPGSRKVFVSAVGDILGSGLSNVDDLLRLPYGCGEQNMINLVPNIVILNYLQQSRRLKEIQRTKAMRNIETGYQRQLNYKRLDGSFSAFGSSDANGSVWLTAYVLKSFQQAKSVGLQVDEKVVRRAANFISQFSRSDGSIEEVGMLHDKRLQSAAGSSNSAYLTAYAMIALLQRPISRDSDALAPVALDEVLEKGLGYLEGKLERGDDTSDYDLAIIAYALHLANRRPSMDRAYEQLWARAQEDGDQVWWADPRLERRATQEKLSKQRVDSGSDDLEREFVNLDQPTITTTTTTTAQPPLKPLAITQKHSAHLFIPESLSIEITALALLSTVRRGELERALPIVKWLVSKQNSQGGFASTQDTVLAIEALAAFAAANSLESNNKLQMELELVHPRPKGSEFRRHDVDQLTLNDQNALVNQQIRLPDNITWVEVEANGQGSAVVQVFWQYNLLVSAERPAFYLNPVVDKSSTINYLQLSVCTYYKAGEASNMALMEVELPSGYVADVEALPGLKQTEGIKRVDTAHGDTKVMIYIDKVTRDELCVTVPAHRTTKVSNNRPVPVSIYDYYNRQQAARIFYEPQTASSCDICDGDTCNHQCNSTSSSKKSPKLLSLHEQRRLNQMLTRPKEQRFANLTNATNGDSTAQLGAYQILPLAPVFVTLVSAVRSLSDVLPQSS